MAIISIIRCLQVLAAPIRFRNGIGTWFGILVLAGIRLLLWVSAILLASLPVLMTLLLRLNGQNAAVDVSLVHFAAAGRFYFPILPFISARCNSCCVWQMGREEERRRVVTGGLIKKEVTRQRSRELTTCTNLNKAMFEVRFTLLVFFFLLLLFSLPCFLAFTSMVCYFVVQKATLSCWNI